MPSQTARTLLLGIPCLAAMLVGLAVFTGHGSASAAQHGAAGSVRHVTFDLGTGRVGGLKLGTSTRSRVIRRFGPPNETAWIASMNSRALRWRCGSACTFEIRVRRWHGHQRAVTAWAFGEVRRRGIRTEAGAFLGASERLAERREDARFEPSCTRHISKVRGDFRLELSASQATHRVNGIALIGPGGGIDC